MSNDEFYSLTPRQFHFLLEHQQQIVEHSEMLTGIIASTIANWSMNRPEQALSHTDYMPSQWVKEAKKRKKREKKLDSDAVRNIFHGMFGFTKEVNTNTK